MDKRVWQLFYVSWIADQGNTSFEGPWFKTLKSLIMNTQCPTLNIKGIFVASGAVVAELNGPKPCIGSRKNENYKIPSSPLALTILFKGIAAV